MAASDKRHWQRLGLAAGAGLLLSALAGAARPAAARPDLSLRPLQPADPPQMAAAFAAQGWHKPAAQYQRYLAEQDAGRRDVILALWQGAFAGYLTIVWRSTYPPFRQAGIPEIVDLNVLRRYQRRGIATALLDEAERRIGQRAPVAGIGVGLTADYGPAQILYVRRGYIPDGRGAAHHGRPLQWGEQVSVDDELALYLVRRLPSPP